MRLIERFHKILKGLRRGTDRNRHPRPVAANRLSPCRLAIQRTAESALISGTNWPSPNRRFVLRSSCDAPPLFTRAAGTPFGLRCRVARHADERGISGSANSTIKDLSDLKGKRVTLRNGSSSRYLTINALESVGLDFNDLGVCVPRIFDLLLLVEDCGRHRPIDECMSRGTGRPSEGRDSLALA